MIREWLDSYKPGNEQDAKDALREIMQEIALAGLYRAGFFERAAFYGGMALRIFYGLDRFSEDLDFSLLEVNPEFDLGKYQEAILLSYSYSNPSMLIRLSAYHQQDNHRRYEYPLKSVPMWLLFCHIMPFLVTL